MQEIELSNLMFQNLLNVIEHTESLKHLSLIRINFLRDNNFETLTNSLLVKRSLEYLDISDNDLTDSRIIHLFKYIEQNKNLKTLKLGNNLLIDAPIFEAIQKNPSIISLSLNNNPMSFNFLCNLIDVLKLNRSIKELNISGLDMSESAPIEENPTGKLTIQEVIEIKIIYALRNSLLEVLSFDFDPNDHTNLVKLSETISVYNHSLINIFSKNIDWKASPPDSAIFSVERALQANRWILESKKNARQDQVSLQAQQYSPIKVDEHPIIPLRFNATFDHEITELDEENLIEQTYGPVARESFSKSDAELSEDISNSSLEDSLRNLVYSESSTNQTPRLIESSRSQLDDALSSQNRFSTQEKGQIFAFLESFSVALLKLSNEFSQNQKAMIEKVDSIETRLVEQDKNLIDVKEKFEHKIEVHYEAIESKFHELKAEINEVKETQKSIDVFNEKKETDELLSKESTKEIKNKIEKLEKNAEAQSIDSKSSKEMEELMKFRFKEFEGYMQSLQSNFYNLKDSNIKLSKEVSKFETQNSKLEEQMTARIEAIKNEVLTVRGNYQKMHHGFRSKFCKLENQVSKLPKMQKSDEEHKDVAAYLELERRLIAIENNQTTLIDFKNDIQVNSQRLNPNNSNILEKESNSLLKTSESAKKLSTKLSLSYSKFPKSSSKFFGSSSSAKNNSLIADSSAKSIKKIDAADLEERVNDLEKLSIHRKILERSEDVDQRKVIQKNNLEEFLPGEAESVVANSLLDHAKRMKYKDELQLSIGSSFKFLSPMSASFKSLANYSERVSPNYEETNTTGPSQELQETLRAKGFNLIDEKPRLYKESRTMFSEFK